jgi:hypothetical protein
VSSETADDKRLKPPKVRNLSRSEAKKIRALTNVHINKLTDGRDRALEETSKALQEERQKTANACALLEAIVRRHGAQAFDRQTVQSVCARGRVQFDVTADRITVRLREEPRLVDTE